MIFLFDLTLRSSNFLSSLVCKKELTSTGKVQFCGCPNQMRVSDNNVGAVDLEKVVMVSNNLENKIDSHFSRSELLYQEERRRRKVRRLDFEVR